jgi:uncharacterized membrane protein YqiK
MSVSACAVVVIVSGMLLFLAKCYRKVRPGEALVLSTPRGNVVRRGGTIVLPLLHHADAIDLTVVPIRIERTQRRRALTSGHVRVEIDATFLLRVNATNDDILTVANSVGCARATNPTELMALFGPKFTSVLITIVAHFCFDELRPKRDDLQDKIIEMIGRDLNGYVLDDVAIDHVERATEGHDGPFR